MGRWAPPAFYVLIVLTWFVDGVAAQAGDRLWLVLWTVPALGLYLSAYPQARRMSPDFTVLLATGVAFALLVLAFLGWRFGRVNVAVFVIVAGLFPAAMDFLSSFVVDNYVYPGQSRLWVFTYIFFGLDGGVRDLPPARRGDRGAAGTRRAERTPHEMAGAPRNRDDRGPAGPVH
ncbi:MAG: hypothetical protein U5K43_11705 [Halofilum sp. (in: g-proteobacteria)]|nr:hypothetical protein [Halofilum sp. (in: g-proteobacteria)]